MTFLKALLVIVLAFWLISLLRLGADAAYREGALSLQLILGPVHVRVIPTKKKAGKEKKCAKRHKNQRRGSAASSKAADSDKTGRKMPPMADVILLALDAAGQLKRKIRIDRIMFHLIWAADDPADAAVGFGRVQAVMGMIWSLVESNFKVKKRDIGATVDFDRKKPELDCEMALTFSVGQLVSFAVRFGVKLLVLWRRSGKDSGKHQEA